MQAVVIDGSVRLDPGYPVPVVPPGEALVRVRLAGICNTDLELARGYMGFRGVPGHEFVGEVVTAPAGSGLRPGQRVAGEINAGCGRCDWCTGHHAGAFVPDVDPHRLTAAGASGPGDARHCPNRTVLGILGRAGAFAEYLTLPVGNLVPVPPSVPDEAAVFIEPLAAACEILDQVALGSGARALVLGDGKLGLLVAQVLAATGANVLAVGRHEDKLQLLRARGIATALPGGLPRGQWDLVVEATGSARGLEQAIGLVRPRGTLVVKTTVGAPITVDLAPVVVNEVRLLGSRCGRFEPAAARLAAGEVDVAPLVAARYPLAQALAAFEHAARPGTLKVLLGP